MFLGPGTNWVLDCRSRIVYESRPDNRLCYVVPVESMLGKLPVVPVGDTGTIPYSMRQNAADFVDTAFDTRQGAGDGSRWQVVVYQVIISDPTHLPPASRRR